MEADTWLAFFVACWLISLSPGPGAVVSISTGMQYGLRRGLWSIGGLLAGIVVLVAAAGLGVSAVVAASPRLFDLIRWTGVAYLAWLGLRQCLAPPQAMDWKDGETGTLGDGALFVRALLINISNPKGYVFLLAVLPSFIDARAPLLPQYLLVTATLMTTDLVVMCGYTLLGQRVARVLGEPRHLQRVQRLFGILFIAAAAALAVSGRN